MVEAACHCRAVVMELAHRPANVLECNCSICRKLGALWVYYKPSEVRFLEGVAATASYTWGPRRLEFHSCRTCGCTTHWKAVFTDKPAKMGINARLIEGLSKSTIPLEHLDDARTGAFWT